MGATERAPRRDGMLFFCWFLRCPSTHGPSIHGPTPSDCRKKQQNVAGISKLPGFPAMAVEPERIVLHLDLDCFYAQVEQRRLGISGDQPLAVQQWGGLIAVNYASRKFKVKRGDTAADVRATAP